MNSDSLGTDSFSILDSKTEWPAWVLVDRTLDHDVLVFSVDFKGLQGGSNKFGVVINLKLLAILNLSCMHFKFYTTALYLPDLAALGLSLSAQSPRNTS